MSDMRGVAEGLGVFALFFVGDILGLGGRRGADG